MLRYPKIFLRSLRAGTAGMTLPEVLVSVAITGIVGSLAFNLLTDFTRRAWEHEARSKAIDQRELAANIIKRELSQFITSVTGPYGEDVPAADFWTCSSSSCEMKITHKYRDIDGVENTAPLNPPPLSAECVDISDARLAPAGVGLHNKAKGSLGNTKCLECPAGKAPRLTVSMYNFDSTSGAPSVISTKVFPQTVGKIADQGLLAMGICVEWPAYQYNVGAAVTPVSRYDRWAITLIPVYAGIAQMGGMNNTQIAASLASATTKVLVSSSKRLAPDFKITPVK
jgi:prepilin-type N-terminal cleavage/methylation domain-containing protein